ncbi:hypothetical protein SGPA1_50713 [Streptomyces misionensis JCM 4497]
MSYSKEHAGPHPWRRRCRRERPSLRRDAVVPPGQAPAGRRVAEPHRDVGARHPVPLRLGHAGRAGPQGARPAAVDDPHRRAARGQGPGPAGAASGGPAPEGRHPDRAGRDHARREPPQAQRVPGEPRRRSRRGGVGQAARRRSRAGKARTPVSKPLKEANPVEYGIRNTFRPRTHRPYYPRPQVLDVQLVEGQELPPVLHRPGRLQHGDLDAAHRPGLARPQSHRLLRGRRHHDGPAVPADAPVRSLRRGPGRPAAQAPRAPGHPVLDGPQRPRARRADAHRSRPGLARLSRRVLRRARHGGRQPRPAVLRLRDGRPRPAAQRGQPELRELPVRAARRPRRRRPHDHRCGHRLGVPRQRPVLRRADHQPAADARP